MSTQHQQTEALRDAVVGATGVTVPATGSLLTGEILLFWLAVLNGIVALAFGVYRWYWLRRKIQHWEQERRRNPQAPPPDLSKSGPGDLDD